MSRATTTLLAAAALAALPLAGCLSGPDPFEPGRDVKETGRTIHLKATVVDWSNHTVHPGLKANLWAFCIEPFDPSDEASAGAIEYWSRLEGDAPGLNERQRQACGVPGPTLRVRQGDRVIVEFSHSHVHPHTIHWHGQFVPAGADGAPGVSQEAVPTGGSFTYEFVARKAGTLWYHCHVDTQLHVMQGLYGMFIVEPADDSYEPKDVAREHKMVLGTLRREIVEAIPGVNQHAHPPGCFISGTVGCQNPPLDTEPDTFLINGHSLPLTMEDPDTLYKIREGERIRIRILNAGNTVEAIHPHGHDMLVTHRDGSPLPEPFWVDTLTVGPAERYDVVIEGDNPGAWMLHTHVNQHEANDGQAPGGMHTMLVYEGYEDQMHAHRAELYGGLPYFPPVFIPPDRTLANALYVGTAQAGPVPGAPAPLAGVNAQWSFPVEMACAARRAEFSIALSGTAMTPALSELTVLIRDPTGAEAARLKLGTDRANPGASPTTSGRWVGVQEAGPDGTLIGLPQGNFTVTVTGSASESMLSMSAYVDYYDSWDEMKVSHKLNKTPLCGRYGNGNDGGRPNVPPV